MQHPANALVRKVPVHAYESGDRATIYLEVVPPMRAVVGRERSGLNADAVACDGRELEFPANDSKHAHCVVRPVDSLPTNRAVQSANGFFLTVRVFERRCSAASSWTA